MPEQFATAMPFPPTESVNRLDTYRFMENLYKGDAALWKKIASQSTNPIKVEYDSAGNAKLGKFVQDMSAAFDSLDTHKQRYLSFNPMRLIVSKMEQLIFNKAVQIANIPDEPETEYAIRRIIRDNRLNNTGKKLVRSLWLNGDLFLRIRVGSHASYRNKEPMVFLDAINPAHCFPVYDSNEMSKCSIIYPLQKEKEKYLLIETHVPGETQYTGYRQKGEEIGEEIEFGSNQWKELWPETRDQVIDTQIDRLAVWHLSDGQIEGNFGIPKFVPAIPMMADMSKKLGGLSHVHDVAASPKLKIPESMTKRKGNDLEVLARDVIPMMPDIGDMDIGWIEIVGSSMTITEGYIDKLLDYVCFLCSAPRSLLFNNFDGGVESGIAIEKKALSAFLESQSVINDLRDIFSESLYYAQEIENKMKLVVENEVNEISETDGKEYSSIEYKQADYKVVAPDIRIQFSTGNEPNVNNIVTKLNNGLMTRNDAYQEANPDVPPSDTDKKLREIDKEQNNLPANRATNAFLNNFTQEPNGGNPRSQDGENFDAENELTRAIQEAQNVGT